MTVTVAEQVTAALSTTVTVTVTVTVSVTGPGGWLQSIAGGLKFCMVLLQDVVDEERNQGF